MNDLAIIIDAQPLRMYPVGRPGFTGGTEQYVRVLAHGLAERGHLVHVVAPDLAHEEMRGPTEWWWGPDNHPRVADVVVAVHNLDFIGDYAAPLLVLAANGTDPFLNELAQGIDAVACFSQTHIDLLCKQRPVIRPEQCFVTGLGVDLSEYRIPNRVRREPGRMLYANDPARGLWQTLDVFDAVKKRVPEATLHVAYDFDRQFASHRWQSTAVAEKLWECKRRLALGDGAKSLGSVSHAEMLAEQAACHVHAYPSDPPNVGSQIHGLLQMELAAAGVPLVLSDVEAFPEVFGEAATILPVLNSLARGKGDTLARIDAQDWAEVVADLMRHPRKWLAASKGSRALAEKHTWGAMLERWDAMLEVLISGLEEKRNAA